MIKKIKESKLTKDMKFSVVFKYFLEHPAVYEKYIHQLYLANILSHMMDGILQDLSGYAKYMTEPSMMQRMKNANKAFDHLVDHMYRETLAIGATTESYQRIADDAYTMTPMLNDIIQYVLWDGKTEWRFLELKKKLAELIPQEYRDKVTEEFVQGIHKTHQDIYEKLGNVNDVDEDKQKVYDAIEHILVGKYVA